MRKYKTINNDNKNNTKLDIDNNISEEQIKKLIKVKKINEITYYKNQEQYSFLKEVDSLALCNAKINLETAFENFYRRCSKLKNSKSNKLNNSNTNNSFGYPKFKSKSNKQSYTTNNVNNANCYFLQYYNNIS